MNVSNLSTEQAASPPTPAVMTYPKVRARLMERGTSMRQFALNHGYRPRTVTQAVERWVGRDSLPLGRLTFQILKDLSVEVGSEVVPGILEGETLNRPTH